MDTQWKNDISANEYNILYTFFYNSKTVIVTNNKQAILFHTNENAKKQDVLLEYKEHQNGQNSLNYQSCWSQLELYNTTVQL